MRPMAEGDLVAEAGPAAVPPAQALADDAALLAGLRRGDEEAGDRFVRLHSGRMLAVARRLLHNEEDARDAVQQAFLSAFRALPTFHGDSRLSTWLHRIVVNASLMKLRTRARRPERSIEELLPTYLEDGHHTMEFRDWRASTETLLLERESRERVRAAIDRLPAAYRTVLLLRDVEEMCTDDAARALGVSPNAVKIRLHRARQALTRMLQGEFERD